MPTAAQRWASSAAPTVDPSVQPFTVTSPSRASTATTSAAGPKRASAAVEERVVERGRAEEHARGAGRERRVDQLEAAVAAADLDRDPGRGDTLDQAQVRRPGEGAVEIDEVEPRRARGGEALRGRDRVAAVDRDPLATALGEADDASVEDVDRRIDDEVLLAC